MPGHLGAVKDQAFVISSFRLRDGAVMPKAKIVYETYGRLAADGRNVALITQGYTSSHHAAGRNPANGNLPGWWDGLIGPGTAIDTDKLFVVSSNMLGSSFGSTNGASIDPRTGQPYGPDFPAITVRDIVAAQKALLDALGVEHLVAVAGPSYGGYQAFQWAVDYPEFIDGIVPVGTAPKAQNVEHSLAELQARLATDPEWNRGRYYDKGGAETVLTELRVEMVKRNGTIGYDTVKDFAKIKARVLFVLCRTDTLFPPSIAPGVMDALAGAGVDARFFEIDSNLGHSASGPEHAKWSPVLCAFLEPLMAKLG